MVSRIEFYSGIIIVCGILIYSIYSTDTSLLDIKRARIETIDSMLQITRDSAISKAMKYELKSDSLVSVINRRNVDFRNNKNKYENEKKNVLVLSPDSTLNFFVRATKN